MVHLVWQREHLLLFLHFGNVPMTFQAAFLHFQASSHGRFMSERKGDQCALRIEVFLYMSMWWTVTRTRASQDYKMYSQQKHKSVQHETWHKRNHSHIAILTSLRIDHMSLSLEASGIYLLYVVHVMSPYFHLLHIHSLHMWICDASGETFNYVCIGFLEIQ